MVLSVVNKRLSIRPPRYQLKKKLMKKRLSYYQHSVCSCQVEAWCVGGYLRDNNNLNGIFHFPEFSFTVTAVRHYTACLALFAPLLLFHSISSPDIKKKKIFKYLKISIFHHNFTFALIFRALQDKRRINHTRFFIFFTLMHADMSQILSSIGPMGPKDSYLLLAKDVCYGIGWVRKKKLISVNSVIISASTNTFIFTYI